MCTLSFSVIICAETLTTILVLNHVYIPGVGSRQVKHFELPLVRYDLPAHKFPLSLPDPYLSQTTNKPRAPRIQYSIDVPTAAIGPSDLVSIPIHLQPMDPSVSVRSASVAVERRIQLLDATPIQSSPQTLQPSRSSSPTHSDSSALTSTTVPSDSRTLPQLDLLHNNTLGSVSSLNSSNPTITPDSFFPSSTPTITSSCPLLPHTTPSALTNAFKLVTNTIVESESSGRFVRDQNGVWTKTMTLQWPASKSHSRWAVGETIQSDLASVRYFVRVKVYSILSFHEYNSYGHQVLVQSPSGSDTLELNEKEVFIVSTNNAERQLAITKYNELLDLAHREYRSKSKSPRWARADREDLPSSPLPSAGVTNTTHMSTGRGSKTRSARRPHTSAGPRDNPLANDSPRLEASPFSRRACDPDPEVEPHGMVYKKRRSLRPDEVTGGRHVRTDNHALEPKRSNKGYFFSSPKMGSTPSGSSTSTTASSSSISSSSHTGLESESDRAREWETQLTKEMKSRRSSDLLGFARFFKKRSSAAVSASRVMLPGCDTS